ncbi:MAG: LamG-like jellyroll fold domain-containing protein [Thermoguttaceae bacterium]
MTPPQLSPDELRRLCDAACTDALSDEQHQRLEAVLSESDEARRLYLRYCTLEGDLHYLAALDRVAYGNDERESNPLTDAVDLPSRLGEDGPRVLVDVTGPVRSPACFAPGGWLFAYAASAAILALGILLGWALHVSYDNHVVVTKKGSESTDAGGSDNGLAPSQPTSIGHISGTANCRSIEHDSLLPGAAVPLGRKFTLASGFVELVYDDGATVLLEGPCVYEAQSAHSGFLTRGKLTARVEKRAAGSKSGAGKSDAQVFTVQTPTAIVTDLGTEFGVEVDGDGVAAAHVLQGKIEVRRVADANRDSPQTADIMQLVAGESARVVKGGVGQQSTLTRGHFNPANVAVHPGHLAEFVEQQRLKPFRRWQAYSQRLRTDPALVAYYTFETRGRDSTRDMSILPNVAASGDALDGQIVGPRWSEGRFPGKLALRFFGPGYRDHVELPQPDRFHFDGPFSVAVWFKSERSSAEFLTLVAKGNIDWRLQGYENSGRRIAFDTGRVLYADFHSMTAKSPTGEARWHLAVGVFEPGRDGASKRLYIDGRLEAVSQGVPQPKPVTSSPVWLGANCQTANSEYSGWIDEVAVFFRALAANEVLEMFVAGDPPRPDALQPTKEEKR